MKKEVILAPHFLNTMILMLYCSRRNQTVRDQVRESDIKNKHVFFTMRPGVKEKEAQKG